MNIQIKDLKKSFEETTAVDIPDFYLQENEILGLVGNNGAGKTTLFRLMLDLIKADKGTVTLNFENNISINPAESEEWKLHTGAYLDESFLIDFLTPDEYFSFIGKISGLSKEELNERLEYFGKFSAGEIFGQKKLIRDFSAGNKQKIGIIAAMINKPELIVLDEPFNFLDPTSQNLLKKLLIDYHSQTGATIIVSSHNLQNTIDISTHITLLEHGKVIIDMPKSDEIDKTLIDYFQI